MFNLTSDRYVQRLIYFIKNIQAHFYLCNPKQIAELKCVCGWVGGEDAMVYGSQAEHSPMRLWYFLI